MNLDLNLLNYFSSALKYHLHTLFYSFNCTHVHAVKMFDQKVMAIEIGWDICTNIGCKLCVCRLA